MRAPLLSFVLTLVVVATAPLVPAVSKVEEAGTKPLSWSLDEYEPQDKAAKKPKENGGSIKPLSWSLDGYGPQEKAAKKPEEQILDVQGTPNMIPDTYAQKPIEKQAEAATASGPDKYVASLIPDEKEKEKKEAAAEEKKEKSEKAKKAKKEKEKSDYLDESTSSKKENKEKSDESADESAYSKKKEKKVKKEKEEKSDYLDESTSSKKEKNEKSDDSESDVSTSSKKKKKAKADDSDEDATLTKKEKKEKSTSSKKHKKDKSDDDDDSDSTSPKKKEKKKKSVDSDASSAYLKQEEKSGDSDDEATSLKKQKKEKKDKKKKKEKSSEENSEEDAAPVDVSTDGKYVASEKPDSDAAPVDVSTTTGQYVSSLKSDGKPEKGGERQISTPADAYASPKQDAGSQPIAGGSPDELPPPVAKSKATFDPYLSSKHQVLRSPPTAGSSTDELPPPAAAKSSGATPDPYASANVPNQPAGNKPKLSMETFSGMFKKPIASFLSPVIKSVCAKATYPADCESSIAGLPGAASAAATDSVGVLKLAMEAVREKVVVAMNAATDRMNVPGTDATTKDALGSCTSSYSDIKSSLDTVDDALKRGDVDTAHTNLDAVETDLTTCDDGFQEHGIPSVMTDHDQELQKLASNLLSIGAAIHH